MNSTNSEIRLLEDFPGWARYPTFLERFIDRERHIRILDVGGGANPMIDKDSQDQIEYSLLDISQSELDKAPALYDRLICANACMPEAEFGAIVGRDYFDFVFSHMFMEHIKDPGQVHRNLFAALKPGGVCIHAYPTNRNIPLAMNWVLPEAVSRGIVRVIQPNRDLTGNLGKFPAFYKKCFGPSGRARNYFEGFGYEIITHNGFAGHEYYRRIPVLRDLERLSRRLAVSAQINWICFNLVVLRKPLASDAKTNQLEPGRRLA